MGSLTGTNIVGQGTQGITLTFGLVIDPPVSVFAKYTITGNLCCLEIPDINAAAGATAGPWLACGDALPRQTWPAADTSEVIFPCLVISGGAVQKYPGAISVGSTGQLVIQKTGDETDNFATSSSNGVVRTTIIYRVS